MGLEQHRITTYMTLMTLNLENKSTFLFNQKAPKQTQKGEPVFPRRWSSCRSCEWWAGPPGRPSCPGWCSQHGSCRSPFPRAGSEPHWSCWSLGQLAEKKCGSIQTPKPTSSSDLEQNITLPQNAAAISNSSPNITITLLIVSKSTIVGFPWK